MALKAGGGKRREGEAPGARVTAIQLPGNRLPVRCELAPADLRWQVEHVREDVCNDGHTSISHRKGVGPHLKVFKNACVHICVYKLDRLAENKQQKFCRDSFVGMFRKRLVSVFSASIVWRLASTALDAGEGGACLHLVEPGINVRPPAIPPHLQPLQHYEDTPSNCELKPPRCPSASSKGPGKMVGWSSEDRIVGVQYIILKPEPENCCKTDEACPQDVTEEIACTFDLNFECQTPQTVKKVLACAKT